MSKNQAAAGEEFDYTKLNPDFYRFKVGSLSVGQKVYVIRRYEIRKVEILRFYQADGWITVIFWSQGPHMSKDETTSADDIFLTKGDAVESMKKRMRKMNDEIIKILSEKEND